jgi:hypothetical protein
METIYYYFDESGEKGFVREGFNKTDLGLIAGIALSSKDIPEFETSVSAILSRLNTSDIGKVHSTELFNDEENRQVRDELLEFLSTTDKWLLVYEAIYPLGVYQNKISIDIISNKYKPNNPKVKVSKNPQKMRIYNILLEGIIIQLNKICKIENSSNLVMVSDHIDTGIHKEALKLLGYLKEKEHKNTATGFNTVTNKIVSKNIFTKIKGIDISTKRINTIKVDSTVSSMSLVADIIANTLYYHIKSKIETTETLRLNSPKSIEGYVLNNRVAFLSDNDVTDDLYALLIEN